MPTTDYSIVENIVLQAALEATYGDDTGLTFENLPVHDAENPFQHRQDARRLRRAKDSLSADPVVPLSASVAMNFKTFCYGGGAANTPAPWAKYLLPISGFMQSAIVGTAPSGTNPGAFTSGTPGAATTGAVGNGTYKYRTTLVTDSSRNETPASAPSSDVVVSGGPKVVALVCVAAGSGKTTRIYRTKAGGSVYYFLTELADPATTYTDATPDEYLDVTRTAPAAAAEAVIWTPTNRDHASASIYGYLDSHRRRGRGSRGSFTADFPMGEPGEFVWNLMGLYIAANAVANPTGSCAGPGSPPKVENISPFLIPIDANTTWGTDLGVGAGAGVGTALNPCEFKHIKINPGTEVSMRKSGNGTKVVKEICIHKKLNSLVEITVEVQRTFEWDPVEDFDKGVFFSHGFTITPNLTTNTHKRMEFTFPKMQQAQAPELVSEDEGITCWKLGFVPINHTNCNDWMQIRQY